MVNQVNGGQGDKAASMRTGCTANVIPRGKGMLSLGAVKLCIRCDHQQPGKKKQSDKMRCDTTGDSVSETARQAKNKRRRLFMERKRRIATGVIPTA